MCPCTTVLASIVSVLILYVQVSMVAAELYWTSGFMEIDNMVFQNLPVLHNDKTSFDYQFHDVSNSSYNLHSPP